MIKIVGVQRLNVGYFRIAQVTNQLFSQFIVRIRDDFTGIGIDDVHRQDATQQVIFRNGDVLDTCRFDIADVLCIDSLVLADDDIASLVGNIESRDLAAQPLGDKLHFGALRAQAEVIKDEEIRQNLLYRHTDGLEQNGDWHLATTVDTEVQNVFRVELKIKP